MTSEEKVPASPLPAGSTIGILGGGQLGRMLAESAARLGYQSVVLDPARHCPASQLCNRQIVAAFDDIERLDELAELADVVTYEFENVDLLAARRMEASVPLYPPSTALAVSQDRLTEKNFLRSVGVPIADFREIDDADDLSAGLKEFGGGVLKTRRFGYDGKGQYVFSGDSGSDGDVRKVLAGLGSGQCVLEKLVPFDFEFSVIGVRSRDGSVRCFDPATNEHSEGILRRSLVPGRVSGPMKSEALKHTHEIMSGLDYVGVIGVEFFASGETVLANEFAPRVHNSGHWTREACLCSQFDQHIRVITGHRPGSVARHSDCEMINLIGDDVSRMDQWYGDEQSAITLYGKKESRAGRKMGHVTRLQR